MNKARLEQEIDNLPADAKLRRASVEMETITLDNIYKIMQNFGKL